jgi:hypothetical protein
VSDAQKLPQNSAPSLWGGVFISSGRRAYAILASGDKSLFKRFNMAIMDISLPDKMKDFVESIIVCGGYSHSRWLCAA